jgi:hypothetical protein
LHSSKNENKKEFLWCGYLFFLTSLYRDSYAICGMCIKALFVFGVFYSRDHINNFKNTRILKAKISMACLRIRGLSYGRHNFKI